MVISSYAPRSNWFTEKYELLLTLAYLGVLAFTIPNVVFAADNLTDIFYTKSLTGSWEVINKFNWLGWIMQVIISTFCLIGLFSIAFQRIMSMLYLAGRATWDTVDEYKQADKGSGVLGMKTMFKDVVQGNRGTGADSVIGFGFSMLPNIKRYSDFNPDRLQDNLSEDDNITTYMLKTALPTIMLVFFFSMGFNGTLWRGYGTIVDGMGAVADKAVTTDLKGWVTKKLNTGESYDFTLGSDKSATGEFAEDIAQELYGKILSVADVTDTSARLSVGKSVETWVYSKVLGGKNGQDRFSAIAGNIQKPVGQSDVKLSSDAEVRGLNYQVIVNTNKDSGATTLNAPLTEIGGVEANPNSNSQTLYAHVIIRKGRVSETDYFVPQKAGTTSSGGASTSGKGTTTGHGSTPAK